MRVVVGCSPRAAGRREFLRLGRRFEEVGRARRPARATVEVNLVGERRMAAMNRAYKGRRGATAILTFPYAGSISAPGEPVVGEIYLCWPRVARAAAAAGVSTRAYAERLFVHGLVHLGGYRHDTDSSASRMEEVERRMLRPFLPGRVLDRLFP